MHVGFNPKHRGRPRSEQERTLCDQPATLERTPEQQLMRVIGSLVISDDGSVEHADDSGFMREEDDDHNDNASATDVSLVTKWGTPSLPTSRQISPSNVNNTCNKTFVVMPSWPNCKTSPSWSLPHATNTLSADCARPKTNQGRKPLGSLHRNEKWCAASSNAQPKCSGSLRSAASVSQLTNVQKVIGVRLTEVSDDFEDAHHRSPVSSGAVANAPPPEVELHLDDIIEREMRFVRNYYFQRRHMQPTENQHHHSYRSTSENSDCNRSPRDSSERPCSLWQPAFFRECVDKAAAEVSRIGLYQRTFHLSIVILRALFHHQWRLDVRESAIAYSGCIDHLGEQGVDRKSFDQASERKSLIEALACLHISSFSHPVQLKPKQLEKFVKSLVVSVTLLLASKMEEEEPLTVEYITKKLVPSAPAVRQALTRLMQPEQPSAEKKVKQISKSKQPEQRGGVMKRQPGKGSANVLTPTEIVSQLERETATLLAFNFSVPTPYSVLDVLFVVGQITTKHQQWASLLCDVMAAYTLASPAHFGDSVRKELTAVNASTAPSAVREHVNTKKRSRSVSESDDHLNDVELQKGGQNTSAASQPFTDVTAHSAEGIPDVSLEYYITHNNAILVALGCLQLAACILSVTMCNDNGNSEKGSKKCRRNQTMKNGEKKTPDSHMEQYQSWRWSQCVSVAVPVVQQSTQAADQQIYAETSTGQRTGQDATCSTDETALCCWYGYGDSVLYGRLTMRKDHGNDPVSCTLPHDEHILRKALDIARVAHLCWKSTNIDDQSQAKTKTQKSAAPAKGAAACIKKGSRQSKASQVSKKECRADCLEHFDTYSSVEAHDDNMDTTEHGLPQVWRRYRQAENGALMQQISDSTKFSWESIIAAIERHLA